MNYKVTAIENKGGNPDIGEETTVEATNHKEAAKQGINEMGYTMSQIYKVIVVDDDGNEERLAPGDLRESEYGRMQELAGLKKSEEY